MPGRFPSLLNFSSSAIGRLVSVVIDRGNPGFNLPKAAVAQLYGAQQFASIAPAEGFDLQGHRGARGLLPENTLASFGKALDLGVTTLETDLAVTKDGVLVISHDPDLHPALVRGPSGFWLTARGPAIRTLTLADLKTSVTGVTGCFFEPALDYVVVKAPRWDFRKFPGVEERIGSAMKSVGEVMAIGRRFEEALQKALRMTETGARGLVLNDRIHFDDLPTELAEPTERRIFAVAAAIADGMSTEGIHRSTHIDHWFLDKIAGVVAIEQRLRTHSIDTLDRELLAEAKQHGFSDAQVAVALGTDEGSVLARRHALSLHPWVKQIDTLAAEYPAATNYLYLTYNGSEDDVAYNQEGTVLILGPGAYRIGSECYHALKGVLKKRGLATGVGDDDWDATIAANLAGPFLLTRALAPGMMQRGWGRIIYISSIMGLASAADRVAYSTTKAALHGMVRANALRLGPHGVTANCLAPGPFATELTASLGSG